MANSFCLLTAYNAPFLTAGGRSFSTIFILYLDHLDHMDQASKINDFRGPGNKLALGPLGPARIWRRALPSALPSAQSSRIEARVNEQCVSNRPGLKARHQTTNRNTVGTDRPGRRPKNSHRGPVADRSLDARCRCKGATAQGCKGETSPIANNDRARSPACG